MIDEKVVLAARDTDVQHLAERYGASLHKCSTNEVAGACPNPRCNSSKDGFHVNTYLNRWRCYSCHADQWYDAVELVKLIEGLNYPKSIDFLLGNTTIQRREKRVQQAPRASSWDAARASEFLQQAQDRFWNDYKMGGAARRYLEGRGLEPVTWLNYGLGVANVKAGNGDYAPAIVMPWYVGDGQLVSLSFRFIEPVDGQRYTRWGSAANRLYGNHANIEAASTLVLVEGEINAMSIWQVANHTGVHVLSTGKEIRALPDTAVKAITDRYETIIVWADKQDVANSLQAQVKAHARGTVYAYHSPVLETGTEVDANAALQRRNLGGLLSAVREDLAERVPGQIDTLYGDLLHGAKSMQGLDTGSAAVLAHIAKKHAMPVKLEQTDPDRWIVYSDNAQVA